MQRMRRYQMLITFGGKIQTKSLKMTEESSLERKSLLHRVGRMMLMYDAAWRTRICYFQYILIVCRSGNIIAAEQRYIRFPVV